MCRYIIILKVKYHPKALLQKYKNQLRISCAFLINGLEQLLDKVQILTSYVRKRKKRNVIKINLPMRGKKRKELHISKCIFFLFAILKKKL